MEILNIQTELRFKGNSLEGYALRYNTRSESHQERFLPGSIRLAKSVNFCLQHRQNETISYRPNGGLKLNVRMEGLHLKSSLPPEGIPISSEVRKLVESGAGLSIEFQSIKERQNGDTREILDAVISGIGLVKNPSYPNTQVELRAGGFRAFFPSNRDLDCDCVSGDCDQINLQDSAIESMASHMAAIGRTGRDVLLVGKDYSRPLASAAKRTLLATQRDNGLELTGQLPDTTYARDLIEVSTATGLIARPLFVEDTLKYTEAGKVRQISRAELRAVLLGISDRRAGWEDVQFSEGRETRQEIELNHRDRIRRLL